MLSLAADLKPVPLNVTCKLAFHFATATVATAAAAATEAVVITAARQKSTEPKFTCQPHEQKVASDRR